ncbi:MAG: hypothetical protein HY681_13515 [Chloroflexi bacterium]|nr:hypothetical protein [Chloroflexota bacterium]
MPPIVVPQATLDRYKKVGTATVWSAVRYMGSPLCFMEDVVPMTPGKRLAARARTLRMLPPRPDLQAELGSGEHAPVYQAMDACRPGDVLVVDTMRMPYSTALGDVRLLQLQMQKADGLVTDGAIRDLAVVKEYGFAIFAQRRTPTAQEYGTPAQANVDIQCAGVLVRPGDVLAGDDDGIVVVPAAWAEEVIAWAEEHEEAEEYVKGKILAEKVSPGRYYPPTEATIKEMRAQKGRGG